MPPLIDLTGQVFGRLTVLHRAENAREGKPRWLCLCECGEASVVRTSALRAGVTRSCGCLIREVAAARSGALSPSFKETPTYGGAHDRVRYARGRARDHACADCGQTATDWSYDHTDPDEVTGMHRGEVRVYSVRPEHYAPRCRPCHRAFDRSASEVAA